MRPRIHSMQSVLGPAFEDEFSIDEHGSVSPEEKIYHFIEVRSITASESIPFAGIRRRKSAELQEKPIASSGGIPFISDGRCGKCRRPARGRRGGPKTINWMRSK